MNVDRNDAAVVFIDPQNDVLSETGLAWPPVRESLQENGSSPNRVEGFGGFLDLRSMQVSSIRAI